MFEKSEIMVNNVNWQQPDFPNKVSHLGKATPLAESAIRRGINSYIVSGIQPEIRNKATSELAVAINTRLENQTSRLVGYYQGQDKTQVPNTDKAGYANDHLDISHEIREAMETIVEGTTNRDYSKRLHVAPYTIKNIQKLLIR